MALSNMKVTFPCEVQHVWEIVTSLDQYAWRSDIDRIEVVSEKQFIEYTKEGYATTFTITTAEYCRRCEFDMENDKMRGHWVGVFSQKGEETEIDFTEDVTAKSFLMKPFVKAYLKKQQEQYVSDLRRALS